MQLINFPDLVHRCAYCGSTETEISSFTKRGTYLMFRIDCRTCKQTDIPAIDEKLLKMILIETIPNHQIKALIQAAIIKQNN